MQAWIDLFRQNRGDKTVMVICGNKSDLTKQNIINLDHSMKKILVFYNRNLK